MGQRYQNIVAELTQYVSEIAFACQPETESFLEQCQRGSNVPFSPEDLEYLRALQAQHSDELKDKIDQPLAYIVFENDLIDLLTKLCDEENWTRLETILKWLESLAKCGDDQVTNLIHVAICENLVTNSSAYFSRMFPMLGETMRTMCRRCLKDFRVDKDIQRLLLGEAANA